MVPPSPRLWDERLKRIDILLPRRPQAAEILRYFRGLTEVQRDIARRLVEVPTGDPRNLLLEPLLRLLEHEGPPGLAARVPELRVMSTPDRDRLLMQAWNDDQGREEDPAKAYVARAVVAPFASYWAAHDPSPKAARPPGRCPYCGDAPGVAILREDREAEALRRSLLCSRCATEWEQGRVGCPACGEDDPAKLPRLSAAELPGIRVEACETCKGYLKAVDLSKDAEAEPATDELASPALDVVALERGYAKLSPNPAGL